MKTKSQLIELSLCLVCALAPLVFLTVEANSVALPQPGAARASDRETIQGKISAKSDTSLTVDGKVIAVTGATSFTRNGKAITISDVQSGDQVKVTASKGTDGSLQAVSVEVLPKE
jgi:co-chaperonin GroES (HSP10)